MDTGNLCIALLHSPVYDKKGSVSVTSIVNTDLHDIARCSRTFGVERFYVVTPIVEQQDLARTILGHWQTGFGSRHNPDRKEAFSLISLKSTLAEATQDMTSRFDVSPCLVVTGARMGGETISIAVLRDILTSGGAPVLLVFGTGWGLTKDVISGADYRLAPIHGVGMYNHLPVRSAVAIILDRLRGR